MNCADRCMFMICGLPGVCVPVIQSLPSLCSYLGGGCTFTGGLWTRIARFPHRISPVSALFGIGASGHGIPEYDGICYFLIYHIRRRASHPVLLHRWSLVGTDYSIAFFPGACAANPGMESVCLHRKCSFPDLQWKFVRSKDVSGCFPPDILADSPECAGKNTRRKRWKKSSSTGGLKLQIIGKDTWVLPAE